MMWMLGAVAIVVLVVALRQFVFVPFKNDPYEYATDSEGNEYVKDNSEDKK